MERDDIIGYIEGTFENYTVEIDDENDDETIIQINIFNEEETCKYIEFTIMLFDDNLITIDHVDNCGDNGIGNMMMSLIEQLAFMIESKAIELIEQSQIIMKTKKSTMAISLSLLNTLKSGQSWYNSRGYICKTLSQSQHNARIAQNIHIIQSTRMDELGIDPKLLSKIHTTNELLDPSADIRPYFTVVASVLKDWKHCKYLKSLVKLINAIHELKIVEVDCERDAMIKRLTVAAMVNKKYKKQSRKKKSKSKSKSKNKRHK